MKHFKTSLLCLVLLAAPMATIHAGPGNWHGGLLAQNNQLSPGEAAARVQKRLGGRVLAVETIQGKDNTFYRIKILTGKGVVRVIKVDANSGRSR